MHCLEQYHSSAFKFDDYSTGGPDLMGVTKTKTLENEDLRPKTRLSFRDYEN